MRVRRLQAKMVYLSGDIEKIISDKYAELTVTQNMALQNHENPSD